MGGAIVGGRRFLVVGSVMAGLRFLAKTRWLMWRMVSDVAGALIDNLKFIAEVGTETSKATTFCHRVTSGPLLTVSYIFLEYDGSYSS
jgi:hypothetical protein